MKMIIIQEGSEKDPKNDDSELDENDNDSRSEKDPENNDANSDTDPAIMLKHMIANKRKQGQMDKQSRKFLFLKLPLNIQVQKVNMRIVAHPKTRHILVSNDKVHL